jgi:hydroxylaminobenzene mutase
VYLFLLGLLIGFERGQVINQRMAHLEGLMNGTCLIALGAVWQFVPMWIGKKIQIV